MTEESKAQDIATLNDTMRDRFRVLIEQRGDIKEAEVALEQRRDAINANILDYMHQTSIDSVSDDSLGIITKVHSERSSLKKDKLKQALISRGVGASVIADAIEESSTVTHSTYIKYTEPKSA